jgi:hypothetical protein
MENCVNHPNRKALSVCHGCGKPFCESCLDEGKEFYYCKSPACQELLRKELPAENLPAQLSCPSCSSELQLSEEDRALRKFHCPECGALVDFTTNPPMILGRKKYTELFSSRNQGDIALLKSFLDDSDIDYYVAGEDFLATYPLVQPAKFFVLDNQVDEAKELLQRFNANIFGVSKRNDMGGEE